MGNANALLHPCIPLRAGHDAPFAHLPGLQLKLWLDQHQYRPAGPEPRHGGGQHQGLRDERQVTHDQVKNRSIASRRNIQCCRRGLHIRCVQVAGIDALYAGHARVHPQLRVQLPEPNIHPHHMRSSALEHVGLPVAGAVCLDLGQSTGGFTDCLLQRGASHVVGVDVGFGQLHAQLRTDVRVTCVERVNARNLGAADMQAAAAALDVPVAGHAAAFDLIVGDLSFISQTLVLHAAVPWLKPGGAVLMLVKPQFELQPGQVGKGGIVTGAELYAVVEQRIRVAHAALKLKVQAYFGSVILGGDGNREFFVYSVLCQ